MEIRTTRLGPLETVSVPDDAVLAFPAGLPGFEAHTRFALIEDEYYQPFGWLQALDDPAIKFLVVDPAWVLPDYQPDLDDQALSGLELGPTDAPRLLCILVVPEDVQAMTANLKAPLVLNRRLRRGKQVILSDDRYPLRRLVLAGAAAGEQVVSC